MKHLVGLNREKVIQHIRTPGHKKTHDVLSKWTGDSSKLIASKTFLNPTSYEVLLTHEHLTISRVEEMIRQTMDIKVFY
ncbi:hypothetical protein OUZ56_006544 [Daphnia magna]|uniref:Uncharacterized protein n=1 Tax=Daphnia magna TaxID=35525 RepID=A0ABQ9YVZ1_9CRUS|nr:hypothetical protein OUZ56_006544 [Daphnia magna]